MLKPRLEFQPHIGQYPLLALDMTVIGHVLPTSKIPRMHVGADVGMFLVVMYLVRRITHGFHINAPLGQQFFRKTDVLA